MERAGAIELLMPVVQPAELWQETGRWDKMGPELLRVKDRHDRDFIIQPTSEEVITDIARQELRSYRQLPKNFFHIQTKFRDERRPRFGIMRGREFTMKDAYSFDRNPEAAAKSYEAMFAAYIRIFDRLGLQYRAVAADTGAIGGDLSHEFQVIADTGEDAIVYCPTSDYAANIELAEGVALIAQRGAATQALAKTPTPGKSTCADVAELLGLPLTHTVKSLVLATDELSDKGDIAKSTVWLLLVRGDHDLNEVKAGKVEGLKGGFRFATEAEIVEHFGCKPGYLGAIGLKKPVKVIADRTVAAMSDFVCGANEAGFHYTGVNWGRDLPEPDAVARSAQRRRGRSQPRRQGRAGHPARHRGGPRVLPRHQVQPGDERHLPRRERQARADGDGLLRHRCHPASWVRPSSRTTTPAASSGPRPSRPSRWCSAPSATTARPRCAAPPTRSMPSSRPRAWTCCSTTAASAPARCSPIGSSSACRCAWCSPTVG